NCVFAHCVHLEEKEWDRLSETNSSLTVRNCAIGELGEMLNRMNAAFQRMKVRKEFLPVQGWIRTTEVTRGSDGSAHPHFHTLMMAPPGMLNGKSYVRHERWV
ncbi:protein rep, partial [Escherichia coli]|nr:protein rep [Escherichia coli]